jgi:hypothetical protein
MRLCTESGADIPRQLSFELIGGGRFGQSGEHVSKVGMGFEAVGFVPRPGKHYLGPRGGRPLTVTWGTAFETRKSVSGVELRHRLRSIEGGERR